MSKWNELLDVRAYPFEISGEDAGLWITREGAWTDDPYEVSPEHFYALEIDGVPTWGALASEIYNGGLDCFLDHTIDPEEIARLLFRAKPSEFDEYSVLLVVECEAYQEPSTINGPGEHVFNAQILGVLNQKADLPLMPEPEAT